MSVTRARFSSFSRSRLDSFSDETILVQSTLTRRQVAHSRAKEVSDWRHRLLLRRARGDGRARRERRWIQEQCPCTSIIYYFRNRYTLNITVVHRYELCHMKFRSPSISTFHTSGKKRFRDSLEGKNICGRVRDLRPHRESHPEAFWRARRTSFNPALSPWRRFSSKDTSAFVSSRACGGRQEKFRAAGAYIIPG